MVPEHVCTPHVAAQDVEAPVPRLVFDAQDRGAAFGCGGDEPGSQAVSGELHRVEPHECGIPFSDLGN